jgi:hypothetical protein
VQRTADGGLAADFAVALPPPAAAAPAAVDYIAATGPLKQDGVSPAIHTWDGSGVLKTRVAKAAAAAPAPAPPPACVSADGVPHDACTDLPAGVRLLWNATSAGAGAGGDGGRRLAQASAAPAAATTLRGTLETTAGKWASFGFPSSPGRMVGAKVMVLRDCAGFAGCPPSGARLDPYSLNGKRGADVVVDPAALTLASSPAPAPRKLAGGGLATTFAVDLPAGADPAAVDYITAVGPLKPSGDIAIHTSTGDGVLDVTTADRAAAAALAAARGVKTDGVTGVVTQKAGHRWFDRDTRHALERAHGWMMAVAWGGLAPLAVGIALGARDKHGRWFAAHRGLQCATLLLSAVALVIGAVCHASHPKADPPLVAHIGLGSVVVGLALLQGSALFFRPLHGARGRAAWSAGHKSVGYATAAGSVANLVLGCVVASLPVGYAVAAAVVPAGVYAVFGAARVVRGRRDGAGPVTRAERAAKMQALPSGPDFNGGSTVGSNVGMLQMGAVGNGNGVARHARNGVA